PLSLPPTPHSSSYHTHPPSFPTRRSSDLTFVILNGEIDLSVGSIYALSAISTGMLISDGWSWPMAMLVGLAVGVVAGLLNGLAVDRKSTRLNSSHVKTSYAVFCLKKKTQQ